MEQYKPIIISQPKNEIDTQFDRYKFLARLDRRGQATPKERLERLKLRSELSAKLTNGGDDVDKIIATASNPRLFFGETYSEKSARFGDGNAFAGKGKKEAAFIETIASSFEIEQIIEELTDNLAPFSVATLVCGSAAYSLYYNTRMDSDIDIVVALDTVDYRMFDLDVFATRKDGLLENFHKINDGEIEDFVTRPIYKNKGVAFHFIKAKNIEKVCNTNFFEETDSKFTIYKYNKSRFSKLIDTGRYSFDGSQHEWPSYESTVENGFQIDTPLFKIDELGRFVSSSVIDRLMVSKLGKGEIGWLGDKLYNLKSNLVKRQVHEEVNGIINLDESKLSNLFSRHEYFSDEYLKYWEEEELSLRKIII